MACLSNSTARSCFFNTHQPFLLIHCPFTFELVDSTEPKELEVSGSGSGAGTGASGTEARSFFIDSKSFGSSSPAAMASFTALSRAS